MWNNDYGGLRQNDVATAGRNQNLTEAERRALQNDKECREKFPM